MSSLLALLVALLFASPVSAGTFKYPGGGSAAVWMPCFETTDTRDPVVDDFTSSILENAGADPIDRGTSAYNRQLQVIPATPNSGTWALVAASWHIPETPATAGITAGESVNRRIRYAFDDATFPYEASTAADMLIDDSTVSQAINTVRVSPIPIPSTAVALSIGTQAIVGTVTEDRFFACLTYVEQ